MSCDYKSLRGGVLLPEEMKRKHLQRRVREVIGAPPTRCMGAKVYHVQIALSFPEICSKKRDKFHNLELQPICENESAI